MTVSLVRESESPDFRQSSLETAIRIIRGALAAKASDIHLRSDSVPLVRIEGEILPLTHPPIDAQVVGTTIRALAAWAGIGDDRLQRQQFDFSVLVPEVGRLRVHAYRESGKPACVMRAIPNPIPEFAELRLPPVIKRITSMSRGLVLLCGATGNGKSTSIAAMLSYINQNEAKHIVTIEDPIEFVMEDKVSTFSQREVGRDVESFEEGLRGAMREDPDVIFVGEVRSFDEFELALNAAESGRLVITTFHAADTMRAITRMVHWYPPDLRESVANRLADALAAMICQRLVPLRGGRERVLVTEVYQRNPVAQDCIRDLTRLKGLPAALERGKSEFSTHTFDQELLQMVRDKLITLDTAKACANSPNDLVRALNVTR
jgi:twitching motility protein PilT